MQSEILGVLFVWFSLFFQNSQNQSMSVNLFPCNFKPLLLAPMVIQSKVVPPWKILFSCWEEAYARCGSKRTPWKLRIWRETYPVPCKTAMLCLCLLYNASVSFLSYAPTWFFCACCFLIDFFLLVQSISAKALNCVQGRSWTFTQFQSCFACVLQGVCCSFC